MTPSDKPCRVCGRKLNNQYEPRFGYTLCAVHSGVPSAFVVEAAGEFEALGYTRWDKPVRAIFDPRDPEQDIAKPHTWKHNDNPALILADIQTEGKPWLHQDP